MTIITKTCGTTTCHTKDEYAARYIHGEQERYYQELIMALVNDVQGPSLISLDIALFLQKIIDNFYFSLIFLTPTFRQGKKV